MSCPAMMWSPGLNRCIVAVTAAMPVQVARQSMPPSSEARFSSRARARGVAAAGVVVALGLAQSFEAEGRRGINRRDATVERVVLVDPDMDATGLEPLLRIIVAHDALGSLGGCQFLAVNK